MDGTFVKRVVIQYTKYAGDRAIDVVAFNQNPSPCYDRALLKIIYIPKQYKFEYLQLLTILRINLNIFDWRGELAFTADIFCRL